MAESLGPGYLTQATVFIAAFVVSFAATPVVRHLGRRLGIMDLPNERSSHSAPIPRNGGYAIVFAILASLSIVHSRMDRLTLATLAAGLTIAVLGAIDDRRNLRAALKLGVQFAVALTLILAAPLVVSSIDIVGIRFELRVLSIPFTIFWIVGYTNAFNFMDGVNGISSAHAIIAGLVLAVLLSARGDQPGAILALTVAGAAAGFLPWNFPSGSIFMGDVGSATMGFLLAALVARLAMATDGSFVQAILPMTPFVLDTTLTLVRRILKGERWLSAHRSHFYQHLNQSGWSHPRVTALWTLLAIVSAIPAVGWPSMGPIQRLISLAIIISIHLGVFRWIDLRETAPTEPSTSN